jgi:hypothetical protein
MAKHPERIQKNAPLDEVENGGKAVDVKPLTGLGDRRNNPRDLEPDALAMAAGVSHGGTVETRAEALSVRGGGGRKRTGPRGRGMPGRDISKPRR